MEDEAKQKRFVWGLALAWAPWVPMIIGFGYMFRGILGSRATGLAAVAGGFAEVFFLWGIATMLVSQIGAIVWLSPSLSREHVGRSVVSGFSICLSLFMLTFAFFLAWFYWYHARH